MKRRTDKVFFIICVLLAAFFAFTGGRYLGLKEGKLIGYEEAQEQNHEFDYARAVRAVEEEYKYDLKTCETWLFAAEKKINRITQNGIEAWKGECE